MFVFPAAIYGMTHSLRCWRWETSTLAVRFWCLRLALALSSELLWREWGVRQYTHWPFAREDLNFFKSVHLSVLYNHPLISPHQGFGSVIQMYPGGEPLRPGVDNFGFPSHFREMLHEFPICHVNALLTGTLNTKTKDPSTGTAIPPLINRHKTCYP